MFPDAIHIVVCEEITYPEGKTIEDAVDVTISEEDLQFIINEARRKGSRLWDEVIDRHRELRDERRTEVAA